MWIFSILYVVGIAIVVVVAIIAYRKGSHAVGTARALFDIMDLFSFEWKPTEEIGKRIHASKSDAIIALIDRLYPMFREEVDSREDFCKLIARDISPMFAEAGVVEVVASRPTESWIEEHAHLLRELTEEEISRYRRIEKHRAESGLSERIDDLKKTVSADEARYVENYANEKMGIILVRKKPGGKRPPRFSKKSARQVITGLAGAGSPA